MLLSQKLRGHHKNSKLLAQKSQSMREISKLLVQKLKVISKNEEQLAQTSQGQSETEKLLTQIFERSRRRLRATAAKISMSKQ